MKDRWKKWWYGSVSNAVKHYPGIKREHSELSKKFVKAIEDTIRETEAYPNGNERLQVVEYVYFRRSHTVTGAAQKVYVSMGTATRWCNDFVYSVGRKAGFD